MSEEGGVTYQYTWNDSRNVAKDVRVFARTLSQVSGTDAESEFGSGLNPSRQVRRTPDYFSGSCK